MRKNKTYLFSFLLGSAAWLAPCALGQTSFVYHYYIGTLKSYGFDFLKIDNQSFILPLCMGNTEVIRQAIACNLALEEQTHQQQVGRMNCMAQNILNIDHTRYRGVTRVSIDYKKYDEDMAKFLSPSTVRILTCNDKQLTLDVLCPGTVKVWVESGDRRELRSIPVSVPGKITINK